MTHRARGFTIVEMLVALAVMTTAAGVLLSLIVAGQRLARLQPEAADQQQRARTAIETLGGELARAGAGFDRGPLAGSLARFFAPVAPAADGGFTVWYASPRGGQAMLARALAQTATDVVVDSAGFSAASTAMLIDGAGCHDVARIEDVAPSALLLRPATRQCAYDAGAWLAEGEVRTYVVDRSTHQLLRRDEATGLSLPVLDNVASMTTDWLGDGRRIRVTVRFAASLLHVPDLVVSLEAAPANLQELR
jgi:prepilin-type N-terminal cleavage/methylation domain-containing protein